MKTWAEFATSEVFASLGCRGSFSCSLVWVPLVLPANCKHLPHQDVPSEGLENKEMKKEQEKGKKKKKSQPKIQTSFDLSPVV